MAYIRKTPWYWFETTSMPAVSAESHGAPSMFDAVDKAFAGLFPKLVTDVKEPKPGFVPRMDLTGDAMAYTAALEIPGVDVNDVSLEVKDNKLIIYGEKKNERTEEDKERGYYRMERTYGSFNRVIALPEDACQDKISASAKDGVLTITIPRQEKAVPESRKIEIAS